MSRKLQRLFTSTSLDLLSHASCFFLRASIWIDMKLTAVLSARDSETRAGQNNRKNKNHTGCIIQQTELKLKHRNEACLSL